MTGVVRVALIGFGEVGQILAADLRAAGVAEIAAWDILFPEAGSAPERALEGTEVRAASGTVDAVAGADLVISAVTAARALEAARAAAEGLARDAYFLDLNSVSPAVKGEAASCIEARNGRYVEAAVMAPLPPRRIGTAMLLGGGHAFEFLSLARRLGFSGAQVFSSELGRASAAKMCRSVLVKGMEALLTESLLTARRYGVEAAVLDSLRELWPAQDWPALARYMISRSLLHGRRRAEEMREVARTVSAAGIAPVMSEGAAARQEWAAQYAASAASERLEDLLDSILGKCDPRQGPR
jgi:3-hydroxyisobutyrate dehydrogenase-like beta-hydroxyacid dehydrogenase